MVQLIVVKAEWDPEAEVWVATSADVPGLVTEADSLELLRAKLPGIIQDLLEDEFTEPTELPVHIVAHAEDRVRVM